MDTNNGGIFHIISWVCLLIGWVFGLGIIMFPAGMATATNAQRNGQDASLVRSFNKWSLIVQVVIFVLSFLILFIIA